MAPGIIAIVIAALTIPLAWIAGRVDRKFWSPRGAVALSGTMLCIIVAGGFGMGQFVAMLRMFGPELGWKILVALAAGGLNYAVAWAVCTMALVNAGFSLRRRT